MAMVYLNGLMVNNMMDNGFVVSDKVKESGKVSMATTFMLEIGLKIDQKVMVLILGQMVILHYF